MKTKVLFRIVQVQKAAVSLVKSMRRGN